MSNLMNHLRFLSNKMPICEKPEGLGFDFVVADSNRGNVTNCKLCSALIMQHNKKSYESELLGLHNKKVPLIRVDGNESFGDLKWLLFSVWLVTSTIWITLALILWWYFYA